MAGNVALLAAFAIAAATQAAAPQSSTAPASGSKATAKVYDVWPFDAKQAAKMQQETAAASGVLKSAKIDLGGGVAIDFVLIPAGKFKMGETPGRDVTIEKPFYMGKFSVTQAQYLRHDGQEPEPSPGPNQSRGLDLGGGSGVCQEGQ